MKWFWLSIQILLGLLLAATVFVYLINHQIYLETDARAKDSITEIPVDGSDRTAIVFGAGVVSGGEPSPILEDRIITAVELYRAGRVKKLLMSGDNRFENYNEPAVMKERAIKLGVPETDIVEDFAGRRTYDTCYRAKEIFGVERAVLVTQKFHLNRALYLCQNFGIDSYGITADRRQYPESAKNWWVFRENIAIVGAWFNLNIAADTPILGKKELIQP
ncbi:MAG: ElyC/SanA/YdcF family protein [Pyrinomonadaceae bacterium]